MAITYTTVEGHFEQAITDVGNSDWAAAYASVAQARLAFAMIADSGQAQSNVRFDRSIADINAAILAAKTEASRSTGQMVAQGRGRF